MLRCKPVSHQPIKILMEPTAKTKNNELEQQEIFFLNANNKNKSSLVKASIDDSAENIIRSLRLPPLKPKSIILVFGGASGSLDTSATSITIIHQILDSVLQYASDNDAIIIDGGTKSGIMELVGQRASELEQSKKPILLGV